MQLQLIGLGDGPNCACNGFEAVLAAYRRLVPSVNLSGPTSFAPLINKACLIIKQSREYHILVIIADGQVSSLQDNIDAIFAASMYPLSIIMVGVGDGPWDDMKLIDDQLPQRKFDNFQFVNATEILLSSRENPCFQSCFAIRALQEIPSQYQTIQKLHLIN